MSRPLPLATGGASVGCDGCGATVMAEDAGTAGWAVEHDPLAGRLTWCLSCLEGVAAVEIGPQCLAAYLDYGTARLCDRAVDAPGDRCAEHGRQQAWREGDG